MRGRSQFRASSLRGGVWAFSVAFAPTDDCKTHLNVRGEYGNGFGRGMEQKNAVVARDLKWR